jgi:hypothetical protein
MMALTIGNPTPMSIQQPKLQNGGITVKTTVSGGLGNRASITQYLYKGRELAKITNLPGFDVCVRPLSISHATGASEAGISLVEKLFETKTSDIAIHWTDMAFRLAAKQCDALPEYLTVSDLQRAAKQCTNTPGPEAKAQYPKLLRAISQAWGVLSDKGFPYTATDLFANRQQLQLDKVAAKPPTLKVVSASSEMLDGVVTTVVRAFPTREAAATAAAEALKKGVQLLT